MLPQILLFPWRWWCYLLPLTAAAWPKSLSYRLRYTLPAPTIPWVGFFTIATIWRHVSIEISSAIFPDNTTTIPLMAMGRHPEFVPDGGGHGASLLIRSAAARPVSSALKAYFTKGDGSIVSMVLSDLLFESAKYQGRHVGPSPTFDCDPSLKPAWHGRRSRRAFLILGGASSCLSSMFLGEFRTHILQHIFFGCIRTTPRCVLSLSVFIPPNIFADSWSPRQLRWSSREGEGISLRVVAYCVCIYGCIMPFECIYILVFIGASQGF
jgi:hypothetical protein